MIVHRRKQLTYWLNYTFVVGADTMVLIGAEWVRGAVLLDQERGIRLIGKDVTQMLKPATFAETVGLYPEWRAGLVSRREVRAYLEATYIGWTEQPMSILPRRQTYGFQ